MRLTGTGVAEDALTGRVAADGAHRGRGDLGRPREAEHLEASQRLRSFRLFVVHTYSISMLGARVDNR